MLPGLRKHRSAADGTLNSKATVTSAAAICRQRRPIYWRYARLFDAKALLAHRRSASETGKLSARADQELRKVKCGVNECGSGRYAPGSGNDEARKYGGGKQTDYPGSYKTTNASVGRVLAFSAVANAQLLACMAARPKSKGIFEALLYSGEHAVWSKLRYHSS